MSNVPEFALADLVIRERANRAADNEHWALNLDQIESHSGRVLSWERVSDDDVAPSTFFFEKDTVLYSKLRPYLNKVVVADRPGVATTELVPLRVDPERVLPSYVAYFLRSPRFLQFASTVVAGAKMPRMVMSEFWKYRIPLPPLPEQRRIAAILDKADALRAKRRQAIAKLDQLLQSVFLEMFGDPVTNPKGWTICKSGDIYFTKPRIGTTRPATGSGHLVVRVGEIGEYQIAFDRCSRVEIDVDEMEKYALHPGDTVLARAIGSKAHLGKSSYFDGYCEPVLIDSHVMQLRPNRSKVDPIWFNFLLSSPAGKQILQSGGGQTAVQFNINSKQASDLDLPIPPLAMQRGFAELATHIRGKEKKKFRSSSKLDELVLSLQQRAFIGTL